ncbi:TPA: EscV/YscV/HrcV family type III secretion system export apparatus protein [Escherichia albertii]|nr:EscV/YscV/HrcV family type III secretion system export apparatus protein [Escherichia albertii]HEB1567317.1 EscV/YscV/HrcV family type III secretion system export apparatus protein [Escherichia albertii]HEB1623325.1 EscV/YscV/HrcV family type III secretion system export apparatus protein [Escherichia albertii]HEB1681570.1 EscV/YscV/HrcV family type III secretion system export apparatus protein [Escherichia albertii]HEB1695395.1 EscV/YscV/HrcV family type III secretion system export apparatus
MFNKVLIGLRSHPELIILGLMVMIIAMLIIPLPTYLIDFLIGLNLTLAILVFLGSFYVDRILSFSSFPSILLITTLFRLALAISTSRLILLEADAGEIITSFGEFVIGDSLIVGFVIFSIVTIVQFIVITKGSERVAEVAARFSLDGMPGKQMSIDADLRAGIIDAEAAKERRSVLERESQLYGSFDGAMKFIKGDAIANIIIIFVNIIGGLSVGVGQNGMDFSTALTVYTILTVGDGLVSQIPALLIAISAGFIVTRVNGDSDNMGKNIMSQLLSNSFVIIVTCVLALSIGLLPGFPLAVFLCLAFILGIYFYFKFEKKDTENTATEDEISLGLEPYNQNDDISLGIINKLDQVITETVPLVLIMNSKQAKKYTDINLADRIRSQFFIEYGIRIPGIVIREGDGLNDEDVILMLNEVRASQFKIYHDMVLLIEYSDEIFSALLKKTVIVNSNGEQYYWVTKNDAQKLTRIGCYTRTAMDEMYNHLSVCLAHNINEYFGIQETKYILDQLEVKYPDLEILRYITVQRISEVIQRLIQERISVRNMRLVMEALALWSPREKDIITLVEHVRGALGRYICHKFSYSGEIKAVVISPEIEDRIRDGVRPTAGGTFLNLDASEAEMILDNFKLALSGINIPIKDIVLLGSVDIRRFIKKLIESNYRDLEVLSYGELTENVSINILKTI